MFNDQRNLFCLLLASNCQRKPSGGDVAAPVSRTKGPAVARDYYPLECATATAAALQMKWRRERETVVLLASFVLAEQCPALSELIRQTWHWLWQWLLISSHYGSRGSWHMSARGHQGVNNAATWRSSKQCWQTQTDLRLFFSNFRPGNWRSHAWPGSIAIKPSEVIEGWKLLTLIFLERFACRFELLIP